MWVKNTDGKKDAVLTMTVVAFFVVMVKVVLGGSTLTLADWNLNIEPISPELAAVLLGVNMAGYVGRRHTDRKFARDKDEQPATDTLDQSAEVA
jgi:NhaP-type Na+/H+ and K+/H+ antiporter